MREQQCKARDVVYHEGDPGDAVFVIQDGRVEVLDGDMADARHRRNV